MGLAVAGALQVQVPKLNVNFCKAQCTEYISVEEGMVCQKAAEHPALPASYTQHQKIKLHHQPFNSVFKRMAPPEPGSQAYQ